MDGGHFLLSIRGNRERWAEICEAAGVPSHAEQIEDGDALYVRWPSVADDIFGPKGLIAQALPYYEMRLPQLHMARLVQRAIEMRQPAIVEAGTGTGKSFAYAAVCMAMGKRVAISTSNKALQMQLYRKDIPFLQSLFPGKKMALVQGKANYACRKRVEDVSAGVYTISGDLLEWYTTTETGNVEEIPFAVDYRDLNQMTVDRYCMGRQCSRYGDCFYYAAKRARVDADVLICNHALLALHHLYPGAGILPPVDVIVVDEAHKFADYMRNAVGGEFALDSISRRVTLAAQHDVETDAAFRVVAEFNQSVLGIVGNKADMEIGIAHDTTVAQGAEMAQALYALADEIWDDGDMPETPSDKRRQVDATQIRSTADHVNAFAKAGDGEIVRWLAVKDGQITCIYQPHSVAEQVAALCGFVTVTPAASKRHTQCTRCGRELTAATVAVLDGFPYGPDCIRHVDPFDDAEQVLLAEWLNQEPPAPHQEQRFATPVIFTSATLAAPDMAAFRREAGLPYALEMVAASPFDFPRNALLYIPPASAPAPSAAEYPNWVADEMAKLVRAAGGGAFLLFTSYTNMRHVAGRLRHDFEDAGMLALVQGELPKMEIVKRFIEAENAVLFATKSFWEGVSIDGEALRLVVIDKMPFDPPRPLTTAQEAALTRWAIAQGMSGKTAEWYPFEALRVPRMTIELKQGAGRLIRTQTDYGVIAILDSRLRSAQYARRLVLPALPPAKITPYLFEIDEFFHERKGRGRRLAQMTPLQQAVVFSTQPLDNEEIPF
jgi:ATP-dependent DNA helicase DinG